MGRWLCNNWVMGKTEPSRSTVKTLFALSSNVCSFHDKRRPERGACEAKMTDPNWKCVNGEICHIEGERPGSARYRPDMTAIERHDYENLILLCPSHHKLIDDLEPGYFTVEILKGMKESAANHNADKFSWVSDPALDSMAKAALEQYRRQLRLLPRQGFIIDRPID